MTTRTLTANGGASKALVVPLTTAWSLPPGCRDYIYDGFRTISTSCVPPKFNDVWFQEGYYSPGVCPDSYTIGCTVTDVESWASLASSPGGIAGETVASEESAYYCVPSNYACHDLLYATTRLTGTNTAFITTSGALPYYLPAVQIRWRAADLAVLQTPPLATQTAAGTSLLPTNSPAVTQGHPSDAGTAGGDSGGLSKGAIAGIAIAVVVLVMVAAGLVLFSLRRRKRETVLPGVLLEPRAPQLDGQPVLELGGKAVQIDSGPALSGAAKLGLVEPRPVIAELPGRTSNTGLDEKYPDTSRSAEESSEMAELDAA